MRISTAYPQRLNVGFMQEHQNKLNETQLKISSSKKYLSPSENPSAAAYSIGFKQSISQAERHQENIATLQERLQLEETALKSVTDTLLRLQEIGLQGINDSGNSTISRSAIAAEFDQLNDFLLGLGNTRHANGEYIFAGTRTDVAPFGLNSQMPKPITTVVQSWETFVKQKAISDAYHFAFTNPDAGVLEALAWKDATPQAYGKIPEVAALATGVQGALPAQWQASVDGTSQLYSDTFARAYQDATTQGTIAQGIASSTDAWTSTPAVTAERAYNAYLDALGYYKNTAVASGEASTQVDNVLAVDEQEALALAEADVDVDDAALETPSSVTTQSRTSISGFVYAGTGNHRQIQVGSGRYFADGHVGTEVFSLPNKTGRLVFDTVKDFADQLRADAPLIETLKELDDALVNVSSIRSSIGARLNALDRQKESNEDFILNTKAALSQVEDLDYAQAITQLNSQQMSLQAAQQSFAKVQGMTLFKYL